MIIEMNSTVEISKLTEALKSLLSDRCLFLFIGEVGAGKTTTVGAFCQELGMEEVASPSFAIHHRYENDQGQAVDHVDLYRLESEDDLESTGFWDLFLQDKAWVIVEWADRLQPEVWPLHWDVYQVRFFTLEAGARRVEISRLNN